MHIPFPVIGGVQFGAAFLWAALLVFGDSALDPDPSLLYALGLVLLATVSLAGLAVSHGRWAWRLSAGVIGAEAVAAILVRPSVAWWIALAGLAGALTLTAGPWIIPHVRQLPPPAPLPRQSMALMIGLLVFPTLLALTNDLDVFTWSLAIGAIVVAWAYGRALLVGLWGARVALLPLALLAAWSGGAVRAIAAIGGAATLTYLAWTQGAKTPVIPLDPRRVAPSPVFPELAPPEVLDAAGYDHKGRPKR